MVWWRVDPLHKIWFLISTKKNFLIWYFSMDDFSLVSEGTLHPKHLKILDGPSPPFPTLRIYMYKDSFKTPPPKKFKFIFVVFLFQQKILFLYNWIFFYIWRMSAIIKEKILRMISFLFLHYSFFYQ